MAQTAVPSALTVTQYSKKFFREHLRNHPYKKYMGTKETDIIQVKKDLTVKKGNKVQFSLVNRLTASANDGTSSLAGNEEAMDTRSFGVTTSLRRNAVTITEEEAQKPEEDLIAAVRPTLMDWAHDLDAARFVDECYSINGVAYASASESQKDAWLVDNADRVLFGEAKSNNASNDHSAALLNVTQATGGLTAAALSLMKRMALSASPKIKPIREAGTNRRYFCVFAHPLAFRDLKNDEVIQQAQREVSIQKENSRLFEGGDIMWDGMIIHEVDDMTTLSGVGDSGIDVGGVFLCGAQAFGYGIAKEWSYTRKKEDDYQNETGIGVRSLDGFSKMLFGSGASDTDDLKQHGVCTGYFAAVAD